jgi:hypothetical protein
MTNSVYTNRHAEQEAVTRLLPSELEAQHGDSVEMSTPYEETKALLDRLNEGVRRGERWTVEGERGLLAMARSNDPFYAGQN